MRDFLGNEIQVGDEIVVMRYHSSGSSSSTHSLTKSRVTRFTPKKVGYEFKELGCSEKLAYPCDLVSVDAIRGWKMERLVVD